MPGAAGPSSTTGSPRRSHSETSRFGDTPATASACNHSSMRTRNVGNSGTWSVPCPCIVASASLPIIVLSAERTLMRRMWVPPSRWQARDGGTCHGLTSSKSGRSASCCGGRQLLHPDPEGGSSKGRKTHRPTTAHNEKPAKVAGLQCFLRPKLCSWTAGYSPVAAASSNRRNAALQNVACRRMTCRLGRAPWQCSSQTALLLFGRDLPKLGGSPKEPPFLCLWHCLAVRQARVLAALVSVD